MLRSEQVLLAITPWCHVHISKARLRELTHDDIEIIIEAFADTLKIIHYSSFVIDGVYSRHNRK